MQRMVSVKATRGSTFVSFSGVDGAGKSTQIAALSAHMQSLGFTVRIIPFWDQIACLTSVREGAGHRIFKGEKGVGAPGAPVNRRDKNVRSWPMSVVRLGLYLLDALSTRRVVHRSLRSGTGFIIFDRYVYDELANLNLRNPLMRALARLLLAIVPRPNVSYVLDADPVQARARKPEYPVEFIQINRQAYLELSRMTNAITVVPPGTLDEVRSVVLDTAVRALPSGSLAQRSSGTALPQVG